MFEKKNLVFYYCTTPLHMGAGTSVGAIDNPIQREVHSNHPLMNGSGIKGAVRHHVNKTWKPDDVVSLFGSEAGKPDTVAGAISFTDANLIAFPVRSVKNTFVYVTSPYVLARLKRQAEFAGINPGWDLAKLTPVSGASDSALVPRNAHNKLCLEAFEFDCAVSDETKKIAAWISDNCISGSGSQFFKDKIKQDFFVLKDDDFNYFVKHGTVVEPHVRIEDATGTAADGALFYTENLPPESILSGVVLASVERKADDSRKKAEECINLALFAPEYGISGKLVQMGGDATTGRGLVLINAVKA